MIDNRENFIIILDTCLIGEYIKNVDINLTIDIYATSVTFNAPIFITSVSFYEYFRNVKNSEEIRNRLLDLERLFHGTAHIKGIGDEYIEMFEPEYWLRKENIDYSEFKDFILQLSKDVKLNLSPIIGSLFISIFLSIFIFESICLNTNETRIILSTLLQLFTDKEMKTSLDVLIYDYMEEDNDFTESEKLKLLISSVVNKIQNLTNLELSKYIPQKIIDSTKPKKALKAIQKLSQVEIQEYRKMFSLNSTNVFLESCFHLIFNKDDFEDILYRGMKYMYMNSPINNGKLPFNDLIDLCNICFVDRITSMNVIYSTRDKRWRKFIEQNKDKNEALWNCLIIGDEGILD